MLAGDFLRVGGHITDDLHHFLAVAWVIFGYSAAILFSVTIMFGSTARAY